MRRGVAPRGTLWPGMMLGRGDRMSQSDRGSGRFLTQLEEAVVEHLSAPRPDLPFPVLPSRLDRLLGAFAAMRTIVLEFDDDATLLYVSPTVSEVLGYTTEEVLAAGLQFHPDDMPTVIRAGRVVRESGEPAQNQTRIRHKDGRWVWVATTLIGWYPEQDGPFHTIAVARDITDLKNAEAALRESEARYRVVSQMSCDLIVEIDEGSRATYVAPGSEYIIGYTPEEALAFEPFELVHPDDVVRVREQLTSELVDGTRDDDRDGRSTRESGMMEYRIRHRDGSWRWLETMGTTYPRADGRTRYLAVSRDVTERKLAEQERRRLEESMQRAQKLESLGVLAGGIAHDFNNLLTPILGSAGLGLMELPEGSPLRERFEMIQTAAKRAAALTNQMLAYGGQRPLRADRLNLSSLVAEVQDLVASSISGKTTLDLRLEPDLPAIEVEAAQVIQVIMNLVTNAAESLKDGVGRIEVRTGTVDIESPPPGALFAETMTPGEHVYFEVADTGCGMDEEMCARIFDPFFTTKFTGRGLGLAAVAGIIRGHRGAIEVDSEPGGGTRFRVLFPTVSGSIDEPSPDRNAVDRLPPDGTVLVIDDDEGVRELAADVLRRSGLRVLTAADGHEGVKLFALHADSISVVLLDRTMPVLSGADTFEAIKGIRADARIILVSGYSEERATAELAGRGLAGFLEKPFLPETLQQRVREALDSSSED